MDVTARQLRDAGIDCAESHNAAWVRWARAVADGAIDDYGSADIDTVREASDRVGFWPLTSAAWGAVFRPGKYRLIGYVPSEHPDNHGRRIGVYTHKESR